MTQELDRNQFHPKASAEIFPGKQRRTFAYPFPVVDNVVEMDGHTMLSTPLIFADWTSILNLLSEMFSAFRQSEVLFRVINCRLSIFEHLLQVSHTLRMINGQNDMSGEKNTKVRHSRKTVSDNEKQNYMLAELSHNLLKLEHQADLKKLSRCYETSPHNKYKLCT